jgi:3-dehydroquinate dehydratase I
MTQPPVTPRAALCGCLMDPSLDQIPKLLRHPEVDLIEWRLDAFSRKRSLSDALRILKLLTSSDRHPVLATNRPVREGGHFEGSENLRIDSLVEAARAGAEWVDIEDDVSNEMLERIRETGAGILLSHHDFEKTPDRRSLEKLIEKMAKRGVRIVKVAAHATSQEDNLSVLDLIPFGRRELGVEVIAFCMGPLGRWSRFVSLLLGSPWTYVQLPGQPAAAPGQLTPAKMRSLLESAGVES